MEEHLSWQQLFDREEKPAAANESHLSACGQCQKELIRLSTLVERLAESKLPPLSEKTTESVLRMVAENRGVAGRGNAVTHYLQSGWAVVQAALSADSVRPATALRGKTAARPRFLVYDADRYRISLNIREGRDLKLQGQIVPAKDLPLPEPREGLAIVDEVKVEFPISELGEFTLAVPTLQGVALELRLGLTLICVPPISIALPDSD